MNPDFILKADKFTTLSQEEYEPVSMSVQEQDQVQVLRKLRRVYTILLNAPYFKAPSDLSAAAGALLDTHIPSASGLHSRDLGYSIDACWRRIDGVERNKTEDNPDPAGSQENAPGVVPPAIVRQRVFVSTAALIPVVEQCAIRQHHANAICIRKRRVFVVKESTSTSSRASSPPSPSGEP